MSTPVVAAVLVGGEALLIVTPAEVAVLLIVTPAVVAFLVAGGTLVLKGWLATIAK